MCVVMHWVVWGERFLPVLDSGLAVPALISMRPRMHMFDCMDGQMARAYHMESNVGDKLDHLSDLITNTLLVLVLVFRYRIHAGVVLLGSCPRHPRARNMGMGVFRLHPQRPQACDVWGH